MTRRHTNNDLGHPASGSWFRENGTTSGKRGKRGKRWRRAQAVSGAGNGNASFEEGTRPDISALAACREPGEEAATNNKLAHRRQPRSRAPSSRNLLTCEHPRFACKNPRSEPAAYAAIRPSSLAEREFSEETASRVSEKWGYLGPRSIPATNLLYWHSHGKWDTKQCQARCKGSSTFIETYVSREISRSNWRPSPSAPDF